MRGGVWMKVGKDFAAGVVWTLLLLWPAVFFLGWRGFWAVLFGIIAFGAWAMFWIHYPRTIDWAYEIADKLEEGDFDE